MRASKRGGQRRRAGGAPGTGTRTAVLPTGGGSPKARGPARGTSAATSPAASSAGPGAGVGAASSRDVVTASGLRKIYASGDGELRALDGVDLSVPRGQFLAVTGASGSGKTTLLNCLSGLDRPDSGTVVVDGHDLSTLRPAQLARLRAERLGFVFQAYNLVPVLSAAENVELPLLFAGRPLREARAAALRVLDRVGLAARASARPAELSGGEQQRVAVARAVVADPAVVWADEPTGNLDSASAAAVLRLLGDLNADGTTVIVVTHDPAVAAAAHRCVALRDGRVVGDRSGSAA